LVFYSLFYKLLQDALKSSRGSSGDRRWPSFISAWLYVFCFLAIFMECCKLYFSPQVSRHYRDTASVCMVPCLRLYSLSRSIHSELQGRNQEGRRYQMRFHAWDPASTWCHLSSEPRNPLVEAMGICSRASPDTRSFAWGPKVVY
jgi:hypothetical protein